MRNALAEYGWECTGDTCSDMESPEEVCGNGFISSSETCEDGNIVQGDGCSSSCTIEHGFECTMAASGGSEDNSGDTGGSSTGGYMESPGDSSTGGNMGPPYRRSGDVSRAKGQLAGPPLNPSDQKMRSGELSVCFEVCGNGLISPSETCDDGNFLSGDGCSSDCQREHGWECSKSPCADGETPTEVCDNGLISSGEGCDDGNNIDGDGCSSICAVECGFDCGNAEPSVCSSECGDGFLASNEVCDDGNRDDGDGCSGDCMSIEDGYTCIGGICDTSMCTEGGSPYRTIGVCSDQQGYQDAYGNGCDYYNDGWRDCGNPGNDFGMPTSSLQACCACGGGEVCQTTIGGLGADQRGNGGTCGCKDQCRGSDFHNFTSDSMKQVTSSLNTNTERNPDGLVESVYTWSDCFWLLNTHGDGSWLDVEISHIPNGHFVEFSLCENKQCCFPVIMGGSQEGAKMVIRMMNPPAFLRVDLKTYSAVEPTQDLVMTFTAHRNEPASICGDGLPSGDEQCDDQNTLSGDGCSSECTIEEDWDCTNNGRGGLVLEVEVEAQSGPQTVNIRGGPMSCKRVCRIDDPCQDCPYFDAGFGGCPKYKKGGDLHSFCNDDRDEFGILAADACPVSCSTSAILVCNTNDRRMVFDTLETYTEIVAGTVDMEAGAFPHGSALRSVRHKFPSGDRTSRGYKLQSLREVWTADQVAAAELSAPPLPTDSNRNAGIQASILNNDIKGQTVLQTNLSLSFSFDIKLHGAATEDHSSLVTVTGLVGSLTPDNDAIPLYGTDTALFRDGIAHWRQSGSLTLTVAPASAVDADQKVEISILVRIPIGAQPAWTPKITAQARLPPSNIVPSAVPRLVQWDFNLTQLYATITMAVDPCKLRIGAGCRVVGPNLRVCAPGQAALFSYDPVDSNWVNDGSSASHIDPNNLTNVTAVTDKFNASTYLLDPDFKALDAAGCVSPSLPHYSSFADICVDLLRQNS